MSPKLNEHGDPVPTGPLSSESVEALLDQLLSELAADSQNCDIFMSVYRSIQGYLGTSFAVLAQRKTQEAMGLHASGAGSLFNHADACPMHVDASKIFHRRRDANN